MSNFRTTAGGQARLEEIIDAVAATYARGRGIDSLESAALPNQRQIVEALLHLKHVLYMGFYSSRKLSEINLRQHIGEHFYDAFETLVEQIARAVVYRRIGGGAPQAEDRERSETAVLEVFARLPEIRDLLALDIEAAFQGDPSAESIEEIIFSYPACEATTVYRIAHEFYLRGVPMIPRILAEWAHGKSGIDIHPGAKIGESFFIDHGTGVVIGETCEIGNHVKLYQGVTLGALSIPQDKCGEVIRGQKRHPTIEDNVTIYAGAKILGGDTIVGRGSTIGGNVWLTESVPAYSRVTYQAPICDPAGAGAELPQPAPQAKRARK